MVGMAHIFEDKTVSVSEAYVYFSVFGDCQNVVISVSVEVSDASQSTVDTDFKLRGTFD